MRIQRIMVSDVIWFTHGYYHLVWSPPVPVLSVPDNWQDIPEDVDLQQVAWPLPLHRVYEVTPPIGDTTYIFLLASAFQRAGDLVTIPPLPEV